jgi:hypothetical protein
MESKPLCVCDHVDTCGVRDSADVCGHSEKHKWDDIPVPWCEPASCLRANSVVGCIPVEDGKEGGDDDKV